MDEIDIINIINEIEKEHDKIIDDLTDGFGYEGDIDFIKYKKRCINVV